MPRGQFALGVPSPYVLAVDAQVQRDGVCDEGAIRLMAGMWGLIRRELEWRNQETRRWLDSDGFTEWAESAGVAPVVLRAHLIAEYWPSSRAA